MKLSMIGLMLLIFSGNKAQQITVTPAQANAQSFKEFVQSVNSFTYGGEGSPMMSVKVSEGTKGSPYLSTWMPGKIVLTSGAVYKEAGATLNFDKIKQILVMKLSATKVFEVDMRMVKTYELIDSLTTHKFVWLDTKPFEQAIELYSDSSYTLYKTVHTEFLKADYVNTGDKYDRYEDKYVYYVKTKTGELLKVENVNKKKLKLLESAIPGITKAINSSGLSITDTDDYITALFKSMGTK